MKNSCALDSSGRGINQNLQVKLDVSIVSLSMLLLCVNILLLMRMLHHIERLFFFAFCVSVDPRLVGVDKRGGAGHRGGDSIQGPGVPPRQVHDRHAQGESRSLGDYCCCLRWLICWVVAEMSHNSGALMLWLVLFLTVDLCVFYNRASVGCIGTMKWTRTKANLQLFAQCVYRIYLYI